MSYNSGIDYSEFHITKKGIARATLDDIDILKLIDEEWYQAWINEDTGDITEISDKSGHVKHYDEMEHLWIPIAPYVEDGSWIIIQGEGRDYWKIVFTKGNVKKYMGRVVFDDEV